MRPVEHTGDSGSLAFYGERGAGFPLHGVTVVRHDTAVVDGELQPLDVPTFEVTVRRWTETEISSDVATFTYAPRTSPTTSVLPDKTVNRLLRQHGL